MSVMHIPHHPTVPAWMSGTGVVARRIFDTVRFFVRRQYVIRRNVRILENLSDSTLTDIGFSRGTIRSFVADHVDERGEPCGGYPFT